MTDILIIFWPLWYPVAAAAGFLVASRFSRWYRRKITRARRLHVDRRRRRSRREHGIALTQRPMR